MKSNDVYNFLLKHALSPSSIDMDQFCTYFMDQMQKALKGQSSSLAMIPSYCDPHGKIKEGESIIVIDAGGTNLRTCLVSFDAKLRPQVSMFRKTRMPGSDRPILSEEFFSILADETERLLPYSRKIGFCFSYAVKILPDHDGEVLKVSKEVVIEDIEGKHLGKELAAEFQRRGHDCSDLRIAIFNDTVSTLLAGMAKNTGGKYESCIGFILGTGTNTAYIEADRNIEKVPEISASEGSQIINVESGFLDTCPGDIDKAFFETTNDPQQSRFEKLISGGYLGPLGLKILAAAADEGLFTDQTARNIRALDGLQAKDISDFLDTGSGKLEKIASCKEDEDTVSMILDTQIARSAKLTACNLASAIMFTGSGKDPEHPVLINADGTTFYKVCNLREYTEQFLFDYLDTKGYHAVFTCIEDSPVIGSAIGAIGL